jgi:hypothetical protein
MRSTRRSSEILKKASHLVSLRMIKVYYGTRVEFVHPTSRKSRRLYFGKLIILLTPFNQEAKRCIKISRQPTGGME